MNKYEIEAQDLINVLTEQRNRAMEQHSLVSAYAAKLERRIAELEAAQKAREEEPNVV